MLRACCTTTSIALPRVAACARGPTPPPTRRAPNAPADGGSLKSVLNLPTMMPTWDNDYAAGRAIVELCGHAVFEAPIHVEGGSIHSDGEGTLLVRARLSFVFFFRV